MYTFKLRYSYCSICYFKDMKMAQKFKINDHVGWNSEAGHVSGKIIKIHTTDFDYKGYTHHATEDDPQYEIKSDKTDHIAAHKGTALKHI
jgi:hypothetical protein